MKYFILDTGLLLGFCRKSPFALKAHEEYHLGDPQITVVTSIVCKGEILSLQKGRNWKDKKRDLLQDILSNIPVIDINNEKILNAYADIDNWTQGKGNNAPDGAPPLKPARKMQKNDLWLAATAHVMQATLLSTDKDFKPLNNIWFDFVYVDTKDKKK